MFFATSCKSKYLKIKLLKILKNFEKKKKKPNLNFGSFYTFFLLQSERGHHYFKALGGKFPFTASGHSNLTTPLSTGRALVFWFLEHIFLHCGWKTVLTS